MLNKKEISAIIVATLILSFTISLVKSLEIFLYTLGAVLAVILLNILAKKIMAYYVDSELETNLWEIKRYGFKPDYEFKKPFPAGAFLPVIFTVLTLGYFTWYAPLTFEVKAKTYRAAKRHGLYRFSEMTESHIGLIAAAGIFANLLFAIVGYLINLEDFARINIYFAFFNLLPISNLDGNKLFFGNIVLWSFLAALTLVGLGYTIFLI